MGRSACRPIGRRLDGEGTAADDVSLTSHRAFSSTVMTKTGCLFRLRTRGFLAEEVAGSQRHGHGIRLVKMLLEHR